MDGFVFFFFLFCLCMWGKFRKSRRLVKAFALLLKEKAKNAALRGIFCNAQCAEVQGKLQFKPSQNYWRLAVCNETAV